MASQNSIPPNSLFLFLFMILLTTTTPLHAARRPPTSAPQPENDSLSLHPPTTSTFSFTQPPAAVEDQITSRNYGVSLRKVPAGPNPLHN
ncbi:hypothetical protein Csa_000058 [Cucumis sativus]|uniref:Uncharacterized protein n=1 Tax=Cucumis sativus TaxID=3659 RepID=A0A0A0KKA9_CUCSA|nr:hypothetical protein Csa_000058 [Cucumis sativus]